MLDDDSFSIEALGMLPNKYRYLAFIPDEFRRSSAAAFEHVIKFGFKCFMNSLIFRFLPPSNKSFF